MKDKPQLVFGRVPPEEEPDTLIFGTEGMFWGRIVGSPDCTALARLRMLLESDALKFMTEGEK